MTLWTAIPWPVFVTAWFAAGVALYVWMVGPWSLALLAVPVFAVELFIGNIHLLLALAVVLGFRWPAAWSFVLLTKVTPGIGLLWFVVRREWRSSGRRARRHGGDRGRVARADPEPVGRAAALADPDVRARVRQHRRHPAAVSRRGGRHPGRLGRPDRPALDRGRGGDHLDPGAVAQRPRDAGGRGRARRGFPERLHGQLESLVGSLRGRPTPSLTPGALSRGIDRRAATHGPRTHPVMPRLLFGAWALLTIVALRVPRGRRPGALAHPDWVGYDAHAYWGYPRQPLYGEPGVSVAGIDPYRYSPARSCRS
ncbi:MAG: hypothetical protein R3C32_05075 [Chloroflexota bacterium]